MGRYWLVYVGEPGTRLSEARRIRCSSEEEVWEVEARAVANGFAVNSAGPISDDAPEAGFAPGVPE